MTIAKEGIRLTSVVFLIALLLLALGVGIPAALFFLGSIFLLFFFREPGRQLKAEKDTVYAPCDGRVIGIGEEFEENFFKEMVYRISIFMNLFNVHVTYAPVSGQITYTRYREGGFNRANRMEKGAGEPNENNFIGISDGNKKTAIRQVAGAVARRIVCDKKPGDRIIAGTRIGIIKFGSRIDVFLPKCWQLDVEKGEYTQGGLTVLARYPQIGTDEKTTDGHRL